MSQYSFVDKTKAAGGGGGRLVAAGTGDDTLVNGTDVDRQPPGEDGYMEAAVIVSGEALLGDAETLVGSLEIQESLDGISYDTAVPLYATVLLATGGGGGTTEQFSRLTKVRLKGRKRHYRVNFTPDLSAGSVDTAHWGIVSQLGEARVGPAA